MTAPTTAIALLSALFFALVLHLGLGTGGGLSAQSLGTGDHAALRHSVVVRDGLRPIVAAEHGDRTSAPPPQPPAALVSMTAAAPLRSACLHCRAFASDVRACRRVAGNRPRAPPVAA